MRIPSNEGKACDAVVRFLEEQTGKTRTDVRHPEIDNVSPFVDLRLKLGDQEYAIEHTRIEPFKNQIKALLTFNEISRHLRQNLLGALPEPAYYELHVPTGIRLPKKRKKRDRTVKNLVEWVRMGAQQLHERNANQFASAYNPHVSDDRIWDIPMGINCIIELLRWPHALLINRKPGGIGMRFIGPPDLGDIQPEQFGQALAKKSPKLKCCKEEGARTILVLEDHTSAIMDFELIGNQLSALLAKRTDAPDEIYFVMTDSDLWWVWPIKRGDDHWPNVGMPQWGQPMYHPDRLPTAGIPKWERDMFQLDQIYVPHPPEWIPTVFEKDELKDLALS